MLAYVFWHRPAVDADPDAYERAQLAFHRSLAHRPPEGFHGSACHRAAEVPWLGIDEPGYEDWYLVTDWAALGVLRQSAVSTGHRSVHDAAAHHCGAGMGGVYGLLEGGGQPADARLAVWVTVPPSAAAEDLAPLLLGDGLDRRHAALWRRELALGPAPEYCVLAVSPPAGVSADRLPAAWVARSDSRDPLWPEQTEPPGRSVGPEAGN